MNKTPYQKISDLSSRTFVTPSQKIIDLLENIVIEFDDNVMPEPDAIGSLSYEVGLVLEIINPELKYDIEVLQELEIYLAEWQELAQKVHQA